MQTTYFKGLTALSDAWYKLKNESLGPLETAYCIRQINIAEGCLFACTHCFASPKPKIRLMSLSSFKKIANEMGKVLSITGKPLRFCYLGAETDLAVIPNAEKYINVWLQALPVWQPIKIYSHGWILSIKSQRQAFEALIKIFECQPERLTIFAISVDLYNIFVKLNPKGYFRNLTDMLSVLSNRLDHKKLKLQVTYPIERLSAEGSSCIRYYTKLQRSGKALPPWKIVAKTLEEFESPSEKACATLTKSVFESAIAAGLPFETVVRITHDNFAPFPSGRAKKYFTTKSLQDHESAFLHQKRSCLKPLAGFHRKSSGFIIQADGSVTTVDYAGFRKGIQLNNGEPVFAYINSRILQENAWHPYELTKLQPRWPLQNPPPVARAKSPIYPVATSKSPTPHKWI